MTVTPRATSVTVTQHVAHVTGDCLFWYVTPNTDCHSGTHLLQTPDSAWAASAAISH